MDPTVALLILVAGSARRAVDCVCRHYRGVRSACSYPQWQFDYHSCTVAYASRRYHRLVTPAVQRASAPRLEELDACRSLLHEARDHVKRDTFYDLLCEESVQLQHPSSPQWLEDAEWTDDTLRLSGLRRRFLFRALYTHRRIKRALRHSGRCVQRDVTKTDYELARKQDVSDILQRKSNHWRGIAKLFSLDVTIMGQAFVPLAYEHLGNVTTQYRLTIWMKNIASVWNLLQIKLTGLLDDLRYTARQVENYEVDCDRESPGDFILRRPVLSEKLLKHHELFLFLHKDFARQCEKQVPGASQMLRFAEAVYHQFGQNLLFLESDSVIRFPFSKVSDEKWQFGDRNELTVSVDTDCVQLLVDLLEHPTCPLVKLPRETVKRHQQCRLQLWKDIVRGRPYIPVTSYLAYTQRINVNICLLSWMVANPNGICQDVPFRMLTSVREVQCLFSNSSGQSCQQMNSTEAICNVARALLLLQCKGLHSTSTQAGCTVTFSYIGFRPHKRELLLERKINYRQNLNSNTLKYKTFRIENLRALEMSFIAVNVFFRLLTASVYLLLPELRNLPGRLLFCFQFCGIVQILCSEVVYRLADVPDLSTIVQIDSSLTLLSCMWLNTFCYQMYACLRHLRLPSDLDPAEVKEIFRAQFLYVMMAWIIVTAVCFTVERVNEDYLFHSRVLVLAAISLSVGANLVLLGLVGCMWLRTYYSMQGLQIHSSHKPVSKKETVFMSVKALIVSGVGVIVRVGFHQAQGIAQVVYYVHIATMVQGPLLFILFSCNGTALPLLRNRLLAWWHPGIIHPEQELRSSAERNLRRRDPEQPLTMESPV